MPGGIDTNPVGAVAARVRVVNVSPFDVAQGWPFDLADFGFEDGFGPGFVIGVGVGGSGLGSDSY